MMPSLQVRDLPEAIYQMLKQQARRERRTIAQQAIAILAREVKAPLDAKKRRREILDLLQTKAKALEAYKLTDPVRVIREDRNR
ncbi:MAG: hypothetical protein Q9P14_01815 [candidate division KSB1 bacterium]|nr:hypothetical protein [candidate division KSB1 bacterium]MDQ7063254.1 hypothetical protein [candidate division KSB1 bacterium]